MDQSKEIKNNKLEDKQLKQAAGGDMGPWTDLYTTCPKCNAKVLAVSTLNPENHCTYTVGVTCRSCGHEFVCTVKA